MGTQRNIGSEYQSLIYKGSGFRVKARVWSLLNLRVGGPLLRRIVYLGSPVVPFYPFSF